MTIDDIRELLQHTADCLEIEARWWNTCAHSDSHNRDIGLFAKGIAIGYQRSAKWLNDQAAKLESPPTRPNAQQNQAIGLAMRMFSTWECQNCGSRTEGDKIPNPSWRWNGLGWEHKCEGVGSHANYAEAKPTP